MQRQIHRRAYRIATYCRPYSTKSSDTGPVNAPDNDQKPLRFVPPRPIWTQFDVTGKSQAPSEPGIFHIPHDMLPPRTELNADTIKLLERLSLTAFGTEKCLSVLEAAIRYADPLLTQKAFEGTTGDCRWSRETVEPMYSLLEELHPQLSCPLQSDEPKSDCEQVAAHIVKGAAKVWEGYFVAPPGNVPIEPKGVVMNRDKTSSSPPPPGHTDSKNG